MQQFESKNDNIGQTLKNQIKKKKSSLINRIFRKTPVKQNGKKTHYKNIKKNIKSTSQGKIHNTSIRAKGKEVRTLEEGPGAGMLNRIFGGEVRERREVRD